MPLELPVPDDSPRRPNRRPGVAAPPVSSFHEKLPEPARPRRDSVTKDRDISFPLGTGKTPIRRPGLAIDSKYAPGPTLRPPSFSANRPPAPQPPPEPQTTPVSATGGQLLPPSSPPASRRELFPERNARLFIQWDQEEAAKLQESQALQEKRRDHFRTQQQYIGHDPWEHEQMKRALPGVRRRLVGALREPLRQQLGAAFARRGQGRHEAFAGLEAGEIDEKHLDTLRKSHPELFGEYDQLRQALLQSEARKQKDDHFRNQLRNLDDKIFQQRGEGVPTRERLGKHKDDLDTRKEGLDDTGRNLYADAERLQRDFATTLDSLHREEERLLADGGHNPQTAAELQRVRDLKSALGEKHTNAFEELSDRAARHQWETRRYNNSVETYNQHHATFAEQPPPWDDTPASREITRGAGALPKTLGDEEGRYHPDKPTVTGPDGKPVSALVQHGAYLKWHPTEEAPVVARMEYDKERRRVIVVEDFDALDEVVSHPRRAAGTRAAIYADPNAIGQYLGGSHRAAPRLSDAEADAYIQSANEENRRRIDQIRNLRFRKEGEINDSGRLMSGYAMWRNKSLNQALNQFGDGAISLDQLNRFAAELGSPKSGAALFRERLDFYRNLHEANTEAKEKAASFLKTTETWDPKKTLTSLGKATNFGTFQGMYRSIRSMTDNEYREERLRALNEAGARQAAEKEEQEREALRNALAELWREIDDIYAKHGVPDEVADQLKMEVAFEGFRTRDRTFLESFVETLNAPAEKLPFTGALAKLEPLLPVMAVYAKAQRAEKEGRDFQLSEDESAIVTSWINEVGRDSTRGAKVFDIVSEIPAFAVELALTGGIVSGAKTATTRGVTHALKSMLTREGTDLLGRKLAASAAKKKAVDGLSRFAGKVAGGVVEGTLQTPFAGAGRIAAGTLEEIYLPDLGTLADHPDLESWLAAPGKSFTHALAIAGFDTWAEVISEKSGGAFDEAASFLKLPAALQEKAVRAGAIQAVKRLNPTRKSSEVAAFLNRAGVHNFFSEVGEERIGEAIRGVGHAATGGTVGEEWKLPTLDDLLTEAIALSVPGGTIATANEVSLRTNHKQLQAERKKEQERYQQIFAGNPGNLAAGLAKLDPANETIAPEAVEKARQDFGGLTEQTEGETRAASAEAEKQYEQARKEGRAQEMKEAGETLRVLEGDKTKRATEEAGALVKVSEKFRKRREMLETAVQFGVANQDSTMVTQAREELLELDRATALIKIGRTGELDTLTPAEENAIDEPFRDGTSAIDFATGAPIITDAGRQAVLENFPEAERFIPMSEAEARVRYESLVQSSKEVSQAQTVFVPEQEIRVSQTRTQNPLANNPNSIQDESNDDTERTRPAFRAEGSGNLARSPERVERGRKDAAGNSGRIRSFRRGSSEGLGSFGNRVVADDIAKVTDNLIEPESETVKLLEALGRRYDESFHELTSEGGSSVFQKYIFSAKKSHSEGEQVHVYSEEEYRQMRLFVSSDGLAGFALKPDGDLVSVFVHPDAQQKEFGSPFSEMMALAIEMGARKCDCFSTFLPALYKRFGFAPVARIAFSDSVAPPGWNEAKMGRPDVVFMTYQGGDRSTVLSRYGKFTFRDTSELHYSETYEQALEIQSANIVEMDEP